MYFFIGSSVQSVTNVYTEMNEIACTTRKAFHDI